MDTVSPEVYHVHEGVCRVYKDSVWVGTILSWMPVNCCPLRFRKCMLALADGWAQRTVRTDREYHD